MKKVIFTLVSFILLIAGEVNAQNYSVVYDQSTEDVQIKINANKIQGVDILQGIKAAHVITVSGLDAQKKSAIETAFEGSTIVYSLNFVADLSKMGIETSASLYRSDLEALLEGFGVSITSYSVIYSLKD